LEIKVTDSLEHISIPAWNALAGDDPFLRHEFFSALHEAGCASKRTGWSPRFITLWEGGILQGAMPLYLKNHSYGEYVLHPNRGILTATQQQCRCSTHRARAALATFIDELATTIMASPDAWENATLPAYLHALAAWTRDLDGYYLNRADPVPETPSWNLMARMLHAATGYE
jgi:hypothetical protein